MPASAQEAFASLAANVQREAEADEQFATPRETVKGGGAR
jgi:hypothetical protein